MADIRNHNNAKVMLSQRQAFQEAADGIQNGKIRPAFKFLKIFPITLPRLACR
jgi:hypothetical protein